MSAQRCALVCVWRTTADDGGTQNDRGIDDPYALTKLFLALATSAAVGAGGGAVAKDAEKVVGAILTGAAGGVIGDLAKKATGGLLKGWPKCSGFVFKKTLSWNRHNFSAALNGPRELISDGLEPVPEGCRTPNYVFELAVQDMTPPRFADSPRVLRSLYAAILCSRSMNS